MRYRGCDRLPLIEIKKGVIADSFMSGYQDSNLGPPVPKTGALPGCATSRNVMSGEGGIRTLGTTFEVRRFSKPLVSASHPPHLDFILLRIKYLG